MGSRRTGGGSKHLRFIAFPLQKGKKLLEYKVINDQFEETIGVIHWRGGWRQFVFQAKPEVDVSRSCMKEIISFIDQLMAEWRKALKGE